MTNPSITKRLFYCPSQQRFFWVKYDQSVQRYTYTEESMTLEQLTKALSSFLVPERRFWDGPNNQHTMLPFNKARHRAFYGGKWQDLNVLKLMQVIEAPLVEQLPQ